MLSRAVRFQNTFATFATAFTSLPIIDVEALVDNEADLHARQAVGRALNHACENVGFFYVTNHGVPAALSEGVLQTAREWFALPEQVKQQIAISPERHYRGYQALGANVTRYDGGFQRDWHEAIDLYKEENLSALQAQGIPPSPIHGPNQWPHQHPPFDSTLRAYIASMSRLGSALMSGIALGLGLPENYFDTSSRAGLQDSYWCVRVIHYPPLSEGSFHSDAEEGPIKQEAAAAAAGQEVDRSVQLSCGEHTDYGLLTLVNQEPHVTALQVKNSEGQWINATPVPGSFVCNIGDMLRVWTNGRYTPTAHRVINTHPTASRVSIPFFYEPCYEAQVAPIPLLTGPGGGRFPAVRYGTHLEGKVLRNFEL